MEPLLLIIAVLAVLLLLTALWGAYWYRAAHKD